MSYDRRDFLGRLAVGATALGALPTSLQAMGRALEPAEGANAEQWDLSWVGRLKGKYKAVFDVPEVESGYGVWRASIWANQYHEVLGAPFTEMTSVVVLRHNAIVLAMQQPFWDRHDLGTLKSVKDPVTEQPTKLNPVLLASSRNEVPAQFDGVMLDKYIARGGIALACNLALRDMVELVAKKDGVSAEEARTRAIAAMVPGVILQPSGVFAALHAQDAGCTYLRAS